MNIEELKEKLPPELQPWAKEYGPALLEMGLDGLREWIDLLVAGNIHAAYAKMLENMGDSDIVDEWTKIAAEWKDENANAMNRLGIQQAALAALMKILLAIALVMVGL